MLYIPKIEDYIKNLTDTEVKDLVAINFIEYFKSTREKLYSKLSEEQNFRKVAKLLYIFLTTPDVVETYVQSNSYDNYVHHYNVEILNLFDPELQLNNTKPVIKTKLKELLSELKKFKVKTILVLEYKKKMIVKSSIPFHSSSYIDEEFKSMHQSIMTKIKSYACKDWIFFDIITKHSIKTFSCYYQEKK